MKKALLLFLLLSLIALTIFPTRVFLKNGDTTSGELLTYTGISFVVKTQYANINIPANDVNSVIFIEGTQVSEGIMLKDGTNIKEARLLNYNSDTSVFEIPGGRLLITDNNILAGFSMNYKREEPTKYNWNNATIILSDTQNFNGKILNIQGITHIAETNYGNLKLNKDNINKIYAEKVQESEVTQIGIVIYENYKMEKIEQFSENSVILSKDKMQIMLSSPEYIKYINYGNKSELKKNIILTDDGNKFIGDIKLFDTETLVLDIYGNTIKLPSEKVLKIENTPLDLKEETDIKLTFHDNTSIFAQFIKLENNKIIIKKHGDLLSIESTILKEITFLNTSKNEEKPDIRLTFFDGGVIQGKFVKAENEKMIININNNILAFGMKTLKEITFLNKKASSNLNLEFSTHEMVRVEKGIFTLGDTWGDGRDNERPTSRVAITYDFFIGKYEVTNEKYFEYITDIFNNKKYSNINFDTQIMNYKNSSINLKNHGLEYNIINNSINLLKETYKAKAPVVNVSWWDAVNYCNWLSEKEGLAPAYDDKGNLLDRNGRITTDITKVEGYRLPTEAEWEYAAKGGNQSKGYKYSGSDNINEVAWYSSNSGSATKEVGTKKPNELGIYDMSGNVWEWTTCYFSNYTSANKTNPYTSSGSRRVIRGGSWRNVASDVRVANRGSNGPAGRDYNDGFRLTRTVF